MMARRISLTGAFLRSTPIEIKRRIASELRHKVWPHLGKAIQPVIDRTYPLSEAAAAHA
jgi:NADPH2:quinone reductase